MATTARIYVTEGKGLPLTVDQERGARDFFRAEGEDPEVWGDVTLPWVLARLRELREQDEDGVHWEEENRGFYNGNHWSPGGVEASGWIGPRPKGHDPATLAEIKRGQITKNAIKEVTDRHMNGVLGREPTWSFVLIEPPEPTKNDQGNEVPGVVPQELVDLIAEAEGLYTVFWDRKKVYTTLKKALITLLLEGRAVLKFFIPRGRLRRGPDGSLSIPAGDIRKQLERIFLHDPSPADAALYLDEDYQEEIGVYAWQDGDRDLAEIVFLDPEAEENRETIVRWLGDSLAEDGTPLEDEDGNRADILGEARWNLGGRLLMAEVKRNPLITPQVRSLQKLLNLALSMMPRNVNLAGFLERIILNGEVPGHWEPDKDDPDRRWVVDVFQVGPGTINFVSGQEIEQADGTTTVANPSVVYKDPIGIDPLRDTKQEGYVGILEETDQLHAAIAGDATASGESRRQAMSAFVADLRETAGLFNELGRWVVELPLALAEVLAGQPGYFTSKLRAEFITQVDPGPIPSEEQRLAMEAHEKDLFSWETTVQRLGIDDVEAERQRREREKRENMARAAEALGGDQGDLFGDGDAGGDEEEDEEDEDEAEA